MSLISEKTHPGLDESQVVENHEPNLIKALGQRQG